MILVPILHSSIRLLNLNIEVAHKNGRNPDSAANKLGLLTVLNRL